ncbi:MAG TPA: helix-turn-helix transcriptional regulator [Candidatus Coproplasma avistercoris]|nr:helix-turn-helix transcriptional regulator [Candidatus Coproplasma avistercoris]
MEIFAERLKELREEKGLTQRELSRQTGIPRSSITFWEKALRVPSATAVITFAKFFGVTADYLLGLED